MVLWKASTLPSSNLLPLSLALGPSIDFPLLAAWTRGPQQVQTFITSTCGLHFLQAITPLGFNPWDKCRWTPHLPHSSKYKENYAYLDLRSFDSHFQVTAICRLLFLDNTPLKLSYLLIHSSDWDVSKHSRSMTPWKMNSSWPYACDPWIWGVLNARDLHPQYDHLHPLTNNTTSFGYHFEVPLVPMVLREILMLQPLYVPLNHFDGFSTLARSPTTHLTHSSMRMVSSLYRGPFSSYTSYQTSCICFRDSLLSWWAVVRCRLPSIEFQF